MSMIGTMEPKLHDTKFRMQQVTALRQLFPVRGDIADVHTVIERSKQRIAESRALLERSWKVRRFDD